MSLEKLIERAGYNLRSISFHSDGRVIAKTGSKAPHPKKLYTGKTVEQALTKLINNNNMYSNKILDLSGLADAGKDELGQQLYMGTNEQWAEADRLQEIEDKVVDGEIEEMLEDNQ